MSDLRRAIVRGARTCTRRGTAMSARRSGGSGAFHQLRRAVDGDDARRIDAAATARTGIPHVRVFSEDARLTLIAIVDDSASMGVGGGRVVGAARAAAAAWLAAAAPGDRGVRINDRLRGFALPASLMRALRLCERGASLLVVTDGFDDAEDAVIVRVARRFDATLLLAPDAWHDGIPWRGITTLIDAETHATRRVLIGARASAKYREAARRRYANECERYRRAGWRVAPLDARDGRGSLRRAFGLV